MRSIALVIPYFGKLPSSFSYWLASAKWNPTIDFLLWTDDRTPFDYPPNVKVRYCSFGEIKAKAQRCFDFEISLDFSYKLCDYKPAYGLIFEEELKGYDFWGHCDIDLVWGNLRRFITEKVLEENDKILEHGHLTLYRNTQTENRRFLQYPYWKISYSYYGEAACDEGWIAADVWNGKKIFSSYNSIADLNTVSIRWVINIGKAGEYAHPHIYRCSRDGLFLYGIEDGTEIEIQERMYFHFQKRDDLKNRTNPEGVFIVCAQGFIADRKISKEEILKLYRPPCYGVPWLLRRKRKGLRMKINRFLFDRFGIKHPFSCSNEQHIKLFGGRK
jgi:hypothetical protein